MSLRQRTWGKTQDLAVRHAKNEEDRVQESEGFEEAIMRGSEQGSIHLRRRHEPDTNAESRLNLTHVTCRSKTWQSTVEKSPQC